MVSMNHQIWIGNIPYILSWLNVFWIHLQLVWKQVLYMPKGIVGVHMPYIQTALNKNTMHIGIKGYPSFWEGLLLSKFKKRNGFVREKNLWYQDLHFFLQQFQQRKAVLLFIGDVSLPITMLTHLWIIHNLW